ncbi:hypothetical protein CON70_29670 [Bacillus pseudomycoides]|nr:hypothetical protein CON70_29670 [Bacillus pseudomycoides]
MELILLVVGDSLTLTVISSNSALAYGIRVLLVLPHCHQAKILKYPQNKNFISPQLSMRIQCIFFVLENDEFLNLMAMWCYPAIGLSSFSLKGLPYQKKKIVRLNTFYSQMRVIEYV